MLGGTSGAYTRFISMRGTVSNINLALSALEYVRSPAFDGGDTIAVSLLSCNAWNEVRPKYCKNMKNVFIIVSSYNRL